MASGGSDGGLPALPKRVAILDACVLYPPTLRDFFLWLAAGSVYALRLTDDIHAEWIRNVLQDHPDLVPANLERTRELMNRVQPDTLVTGYAAITDTLTLPDPNDRHVLAAAIHAKAGSIVTFNRKDFPAGTLARYGVRAISPDAFVLELSAREGRRREIVAMAGRARRNMKNPPRSVSEYLDGLRRNQLPRTADLLAVYAEEL